MAETIGLTRADAMQAFVAKHIAAPFTLHPLAGDASFRRYVRVLQGEWQVMVMDAPPAREDVRPFMKVAEYLYQAGYSAPHLIAADIEQGFLLLEDLGDETFARLLKKDTSEEEKFYCAAVELLAHWHMEGLQKASLIQLPSYDSALLLNEIKLFSNWFLPQVLEEASLQEAQTSYVNMWEKLLKDSQLSTNQFVHRDYHVDNLMWLPEREGNARVGLLDFQDAVMGDAAYDVVSLLEDARRDVSPMLAQKMLAHYLALTKKDVASFRAAYALLGAQRNSKIVGIFTRLAARDGKQHYLDFLPRVWGHLAQDAKHPTLAPLHAWLEQYVPAAQRGVITITKNAQALGLAA